MTGCFDCTWFSATLQLIFIFHLQNNRCLTTCPMLYVLLYSDLPCVTSSVNIWHCLQQNLMTRSLTKQQGSKFSLRICLFLVQTEATGAIWVYVALPGKARSPLLSIWLVGSLSSWVLTGLHIHTFYFNVHSSGSDHKKQWQLWLWQQEPGISFELFHLWGCFIYLYYLYACARVCVAGIVS